MAKGAQTFAYVVNTGAGGDHVSAYAINAATGALTAVAGSPFAAGSEAAYVAVDPMGKFAYVANTFSGDVSAYTINAGTGALTAVAGSPFAAGDRPYDVTVDPAGKFAYVTNYFSNDVSAYTINAGTGALTAVAGSPFAAGSFPVSVTVDPAGKFAWVANRDSNNVSAYAINAATGALMAVAGSPFAAGSSPRSVTADPAGKFAYVVNSLSNNVSAYAINAATGALTALAGSPFAAGSYPIEITVDPAGKFAYVTNYDDNNVSAYTIDAATGALTVVAGSPFAAGTFPGSVAVDPAGKFVYVANFGGGNVSAYAINAATGALTAVAGSPFAVGSFPVSVVTAAPFTGIAPTIGKTFSPVTIPVGGSSTLTLTLGDANASALTGGAFTDTLVNMSAAGGAVGGTCKGTTPNALAAGATALSFTNIRIPAGGCTVAFTVTSSAPGAQNNTASGITTTLPPTAGAASNTAVLTVVAPPTILKRFSPGRIVPGGVTTVTFAIANPNPAIGLSNVSLSDSLPAGMTVAAPNGLNNSCGGTPVATAGSGSISLTGGSLTGGASCILSVNVTAVEGQYSNTATVSAVAAGVSLTSVPGTAVLSVALAPLLSKSFGEVSIGPGNTVSLTFTARNPNAGTTLTGIGFNDPLPAGLKVASPSVVTGSCGGGVITAAPGSGLISLASAALAAGASCTFSVNVTADGTVQGLVVNTSGAVTSLQSPAGNVAVANVFVGDPFQVSYAANLAVGDSFVNITNTGGYGAALQAGTTAAITGAICANVYAFTPDEQLVSCCSCPVTPNGLVSLSAKSDLAGNTLTPAVPTALVVKVIATLPVGGSCTNSAVAVGSPAVALANGLKIYGTTLHATPAAGSFGITETPFSTATLSLGEQSRAANLCNFIIANGSGFGICRSCRLGGLGSERQ